VSEPTARRQTPAETAAADPPLEPAHAVGELVQVRLAEHYRALGFQRVDDWGVLLGDVVREEVRSIRGPEARCIDQILHRYEHAGEAAAARRLGRGHHAVPVNLYESPQIGVYAVQSCYGVFARHDRSSS
jgi:hypothetical protein